MDAKRLEELVTRCNAACESQDFGMAEFLDTKDLADLARCAAAWAKVERMGVPLWLVGADEWKATCLLSSESTGCDTAIAAIEAAPAVKL
jgi:hypothetical protein